MLPSLASTLDPVQRGRDGLLHRDSCPFLARAGPPGPSMQPRGASDLLHQRVPLRSSGGRSACVRPLFGLGELGLEVAQPLPVRRQGLPVGQLTQAGLDRRPRCPRRPGPGRQSAGPGGAPAAGGNRNPAAPRTVVAVASGPISHRPPGAGAGASAEGVEISLAGDCIQATSRSRHHCAPMRSYVARACARGRRRWLSSPSRAAARARVSSVTPWNMTAPALITARPS